MLLSTLQDTIVGYLTDAFIYDRAVDPALLVESLHLKHPDIPLSELEPAIRRVAAGIGVVMKGNVGDARPSEIAYFASL